MATKVSRHKLATRKNSLSKKPDIQSSSRKLTKQEATLLRVINSSIAESILGFNPLTIGTELNQVETLYLNERWYLISNQRQILSQAYVEHGLIQTLVDVPVDDGMRGGVEIKSKQLSSDQVEELHTYVEREDILGSVVGRALKWNRLYGGAGILILTDQDPMDPLDVQALSNEKLEFRAVDMWELFWDKQNVEGFNPAIEEPKWDYYSYYGMKIHKTRVKKLRGLEPPSFIRPRLRGWGFSVVESIIPSLNQYFKSNNLAFEVLDEFKIDIYKIKGMAESAISAEGLAAIQNRIRTANQQKNFQSAIAMDIEDDYAQKQLSFAGLADIMKEIRIQIASDLRMPLTKIFGVSATGFNSGEDDIENYNSMVEATVRAKCKYEIIYILELLCMKLFGMIPDDLKIEFKSLRILSSIDEEAVKTAKFTRILQARQAGEISAEAFADACNKDNLLSVQVDVHDTKLEGDEENFDGNGESAPNKVDTQRGRESS